MDRNLDGFYFRVQRDGKWESVCFSDLTDEEMTDVMKDRPVSWLQSLCKGLARTIKAIGDECNIVAE